MEDNLEMNSCASCQCNNIMAVPVEASNDSINITVPPAQPCTCVPYQLLCCCGPQNGITVVQPACQNLPDGSVVNNPAYVASINKSFWTYKFMTDCGGSTTKAISNFGIPVCQLILANNLVVSEKIDGCGTFTPVSFTLTSNDPNLGPAPQGFQFVKVENNGRYEKGVTVEYRLEIIGDFPSTIQPIKVKAGSNVLTFDCGCFQVPQCNPQGKLSITKNCGYTIINNQAALNYSLTVNNIGNADLTNVQFQDVITIPIRLTVGTIVVSPPTPAVDTSSPGQIKITGNLGTIVAGGQVPITYTIPITGVSEPGIYVISNTATVAATGTQASASCSSFVNVVQISTQKCCVVSDINKAIFRITLSSIGLSPNILVDIFDDLFIPGGVTVQFNNFDGATATFANSGQPVPVNTNIIGPVRIRLVANSLLVPQSGTALINIAFTLISSTAPGTATIQNAVETVTPSDPSKQIFLGAGSLPAEADMDIQLNLVCKKVCGI